LGKSGCWFYKQETVYSEAVIENVGGKLQAVSQYVSFQTTSSMELSIQCDTTKGDKYFWIKFKVCKSMHHCTIQIDHQTDATAFSWSGRQARPRINHRYHHDTKVKPEAITAVVELLMMGGRKPETC
jgi:hypothetical protein